MLRRLFALVVLTGLVAGGYVLWRGGRLDPPELGEVGRTLDDVKLTGSVKAALGLNRHLKGSRIEVSTERGVVTLRGEVGSAEARDVAAGVAGAVPRVAQVVNHLEVSPRAQAPDDERRSLGESIDDRALEVQVRLALSLRRELDGTDLRVQAYRRHVTLSGEAASAGQRAAAMAAARDTTGVASVTDEIRVRAGGGGGREEAERAVRSNPHLSAYDLTVEERDGRLRLSGRVRTGAERDLAGLVAERAAGVPVENALQVRP